ncbi:MAG: hypothetical protein RKK15_02225 [Defluviicoccus sp.]|nr:hypothetical protein [Defluviicoccus sp.]
MWQDVVSDLEEKWKAEGENRPILGRLIARLFLDMAACTSRYKALKAAPSNVNYLSFSRSLQALVGSIGELDETARLVSDRSRDAVQEIPINGEVAMRRSWQSFLALAFQLASAHTLESITELSRKYNLPLEAAVIPLLVDEEFGDGMEALRSFITANLKMDELFRKDAKGLN